MFEQSRETTLAYLVRAATAAESLRQRFPGRLVFCVGTESSLFTRGIVPGRSAGQRVANIRAAGLHPPSRQADISASGSGQPAGSGASPPAARLRGSRQPMAGAGWGAGLGAGADAAGPLARHRRLRGGIVGVPPAQGPGRVLEQRRKQ